jgi:hypothetical protein
MIRRRPRWWSVSGDAAFRSRSEGRHALLGLPWVGLVIPLVIPPAVTRQVRNALNRRPR